MGKHLTIRVFGRVQGVFFRHSAKEKARELGLSITATNEADGSVRLDVDGDEQAFSAFIEWCRHGPPGARVEQCEVVPDRYM